MTGYPGFQYLFLIIILLSGLSSFQVSATEDKVVSIVYVGEKGDFSYLQRAFQGLARAENELNISVRDIPWNASMPVDPVTDSNGTKSRAVIIMGDIMNGYEKNLTLQYPDVPVIMIDGGGISGHETKSVSFSMYGTCYLAGVLAANQTKTGKIGLIAGVNAPVLMGFIDGFTDGAQTENPDVIVNVSYLADDYSGFSMPDKAGELTGEMYRNGTDIIFQVAGSSGTGVIDTAKTLPGVFVIGSDSDQSGLAPGTVMASAIKSLDIVIFDELKEIFSGTYVPGRDVTGLKDEGSSLVINPVFDNLSAVIEIRKGEAIEKEKEYLITHPLIQS